MVTKSFIRVIHTSVFFTLVPILLAISIAACSDNKENLTQSSAKLTLAECIGTEYPIVNVDPIFIENNKAQVGFKFSIIPYGKKRFKTVKGNSKFALSEDGKWYLQRVSATYQNALNPCNAIAPFHLVAGEASVAEDSEENVPLNNELTLLHKEKKEFGSSSITETCYISNNSPDLKGIRIGDKANKVISELKIPNEFPKNSKWQSSKSNHPSRGNSISLGADNEGGYVSLAAYLNDDNLVKEVLFEHKCSDCNFKETERALIKQLGKPDKEKSQQYYKYLIWSSKERGYGFSMEHNEIKHKLTLRLGAICDT